MKSTKAVPFAGRDGVFGNAAQNEDEDALRLFVESRISGMRAFGGPYTAISDLVKKVEKLLTGLDFMVLVDDEELDYGARIYFKGEQLYGKVIIRSRQTGKAEAQVVWLRKLPAWVKQAFFWKTFGKEGE